MLQARQHVLGTMRSGERNLLVATAVAEEGLDLPACCLVLRFDLPIRYTSCYIARKKHILPVMSFLIAAPPLSECCGSSGHTRMFPICCGSSDAAQLASA